MIVIADSGSTKADWRVILQNDDVKEFATNGLNPFFVGVNDFRQELINSFPTECSSEMVTKVFFYGAGCAAKERSIIAQQGINLFFPNALVEVHSDVLAAARAVFGLESGIVVILGTGANVGYYNGCEVVNYTPSLGYAIGDEGSGAYLGKKILRSWFYSEMPSNLIPLFEKQYRLTLNTALHSLYTEPMPSKFLAGFVPFLLENRKDPFVEDILKKSFGKLVQRQIVKIPMFPTAPVGVVGSVGTLFNENICNAISCAGGRVAKTVQYPIDELCLFHQNKI